MQKIKGNKTRITLSEAKKSKGKSNLAKIAAEQRKEMLASSKKK